MGWSSGAAELQSSTRQQENEVFKTHLMILVLSVLVETSCLIFKSLNHKPVGGGNLMSLSETFYECLFFISSHLDKPTDMHKFTDCQQSDYTGWSPAGETWLDIIYLYVKLLWAIHSQKSVSAGQTQSDSAATQRRGRFNNSSGTQYLFFPRNKTDCWWHMIWSRDKLWFILIL